MVFKSTDQYALLDSGQGLKLEQFGPLCLVRPAAQALWTPKLPAANWERADARFTRSDNQGWQGGHRLPAEWTIDVCGIKARLSSTDFGHLGLFPEQRPFWLWIQKKLKQATAPRVLNLFAYSGIATLAAALGGASVCHLDASKGMVEWARHNAKLNNLDKAPIRWIIDDVSKFLAREIKRGQRYDAIILDPPTFGRGNSGEIFKIEEHLLPILRACRMLISDTPLFVLFSCHTPGFTPLVLNHLLQETMQGIKGVIDYGEMILTGSAEVLPLPSGAFARWCHEAP